MAQNAKDIRLRELKDLLSELRETNQLLQKTPEEVQKEKAVLRQERDNFKEPVDYLMKKRFGSSSEKGACGIPGQMNLFNEAESETGPSAEADDIPAPAEQTEQTKPESRPWKKRPTNKERLKGIPVKKVYLGHRLMSVSAVNAVPGWKRSGPNSYAVNWRSSRPVPGWSNTTV